jgi:hypothetical protein
MARFIGTFYLPVQM